MTTYHTPKLATYKQQEQLLEQCNKKYTCIVLLMLDCGLRITEVLRLQVKDLNFMDNEVRVLSLKKRDKSHFRAIPFSQRLLKALGEYWKELKDKRPDAYLFPTGHKYSDTPHLTRGQAWKYIKKKSNGSIHPHVLRHTCATRIVNEGNDIRIAKEVLGHESVATTEIYLHVEQQQIKQAIASIEKIPLHLKLYQKFFPPKKVILTPTTEGMTKFHVGRRKELKKLADLRDKKVNTYINGPQGIGKSHLLDNMRGERILRLDEFAGKQALANLVLELFNGDKESIKEMLYGDRGDLGKVVYKESIKRLTELIIQITEKDEYTIIIDDATNITRTGVRILEKLKNHFHLIVAAREIKIDKGSFLSNFEKVELQPLNRVEAIELINLASRPIHERIEDYEAYKNHIWESTNGNPLFILEMIDRYSKEADISLEVTKDLRHTAAMQPLDMSLPFIIMVSSLMVLRYIGGEFGDDEGAFRLIGGAFLVFALFGRPLLRIGKRKFV